MIHIFWICVFIMFYHIVFYSSILKLLILLKKKKENIPDQKSIPSVIVLCPAFNEEKSIENKIKSFLSLNYPKEKIKMIVISDDSYDKTNEIVEKYTTENIELVIQKPRKGKPSGHNLVEPDIHCDYVLSTDANSIFDPETVNELVKIISQDENIGIVSGALKLVNKSGESGEGIYWKYESYIKKIESDFYSILGSNGSVFLIKRELFTQIHPSSVDDFERTLQVLRKGFRGKYNPNAKVYENNTQFPTEELKRKVRIISREWFALKRNSKLLDPFFNIKISWMLISHKLIRWTLFLWTFCILLSNIFLSSNSVFFMILLIFQVLIYSCGFIEIILEKKKVSVKFLKIPGYMIAMIISSLLAFIRFIKCEENATWSTVREKPE